MRAITRNQIDELIQQAEESPRLRAMLSLHQPEDLVQRMVNALAPGTYIPPHKHENPDKVKLFSLLKGHIAVLHFNDLGEVDNIMMMTTNSPICIIDVAPRSYHTMIALEPSAILEIIQGPYDQATHKQIADWAPTEDNPKAGDYLLHLEAIIHNWSETERDESLD